MTAEHTDEIGTIYTLESSEAREVATFDLGGKVTLCSANVVRSRGVRRFRAWYLQSDKGLLDFRDDEENSLSLCEIWLDTNGYTRGGDLPPEVFEYTRYNAE